MLTNGHEHHAGPQSLMSLSRAIGDLYSFLVNFCASEMSDDDCMALAVAAVSGHTHAEFLVGSAYDGADDRDNAIIWYQRAAEKGFAPAQIGYSKIAFCQVPPSCASSQACSFD